MERIITEMNEGISLNMSLNKRKQHFIQIPNDWMVRLDEWCEKKKLLDSSLSPFVFV